MPLRFSRQAEFEAIRRMLRDEPTSPAAIAERVDVIDKLMEAISSRDAIYEVLAREWNRLTQRLQDLSSPGRGSPIARPVVTGSLLTRSAEDYAAAEEAWQRKVAPAWRLPEPHTTRDAPSVRLDGDTAPRVKVVLARSAWDAITAECQRCGEVETGGWLAGPPAATWHHNHSVTHATVAASARTAMSVRLSTDDFVRLDSQLRDDARSGRGENMRALGDWHTHTYGDATPSETDLRGWARDLDTIGDHNMSLTSLILCRRQGRDSWALPIISGWVTRHARSSFGERMVCEPATARIA